MNSVYKYSLKLVNGPQVVEMPARAVILSSQVQHGQVQVWAEVDPSHSNVERRFVIRGTGHPYEKLEPEKFIGTTQMNNGASVWHIFEVFGPEAALADMLEKIIR